MIITRKMMYALIGTAFLLTFLVFEVPKDQNAGTLPVTGAKISDTSGAVIDDKVRPNVQTTFNSEVSLPVISEEAHLDQKSSVIGKVHIESKVYVGPFVSVRGDEGQGLFIGEGSNLQDGVVIHALETEKRGKPIAEHLVEKDGKQWAVYIGEDVSVAHQAQVHGPALVEDEVFLGMQSFVFNASIGEGSVIEPGAKVIGVTVPANRYVPAGKIITNQKDADSLPKITKDYQYYGINETVTTVNQELAEEYSKDN